jgi:hypothetical protein
MNTFIKLAPFVALTSLLVAGCAYEGRGNRNRERASIAVGTGGYYDGYYDGSYGAFNDGYWGNDGAFYYADSNHNWQRDGAGHFRRDNGGDGWSAFNGSGAHRGH